MKHIFMGIVFLLLLILGRAQDVKNTTEVDDDRRILRQSEWVNCGRNKFPNGGRAFHCKTNNRNPSEDWCRNYMKTTRGAIGMQWAKLYGWQGHCIVYFDKSVRSCPRGVRWYQNYWKGEDFDRDGTCSRDTGDGRWVYEYKRSSRPTPSELIKCGNRKFPNGGFGFHCKTNSGNPSESWCRNYVQKTRGAVGMQYARLYSSRLGHCIVYFDKSVQSCPRDIRWYQNYWRGSDFNRDGTCSNNRDNTWIWEYKRSKPVVPTRWVNCGRNQFPNGGRAFHCKTNNRNPSERWCRNYTKRTRGAIGMQWAKLYGWQGHCIVYFDKSVKSCPRGVRWYQNYFKGHDFNRDGTCSRSTGDGRWVYEYKTS